MRRTRSRRFILVGDSRDGRRLMESFQQVAPRHWRWVGAVADGSVAPGLGTVLGESRKLAEIAARHQPTDIVMTHAAPGLVLTRTLLQLAGSGVRVVDARTLSEELTHRVDVLGDENVWISGLGKLTRKRNFASTAKRAMDIAAGVFATVALAMVVLPVGLGLKLERAGPVFVAEKRVGRLGRHFTLLRLRTARIASTSRPWPFSDPPPPTWTGQFVRRLGLDRLPQGFAILSGHLSLVGPRAAEPETMSRMERESPVFLLRTLVKPGLIGWEQLHRESRSVYDTLRPLEYDLYYVKHQSICLDLRILVQGALMLLGLSRASAD